MGKGSKRIRSVPVTVRFGEPYTVVYSGEGESVPRDVLERECFAVMSRIEALLPAEMRPTAEEKLAWYGRSE
jgi:hypothetical protein